MVKADMVNGTCFPAPLLRCHKTFPRAIWDGRDLACGRSPEDGASRTLFSYLPFFNLSKPEKDGVVYGIGWSGQWSAHPSIYSNFRAFQVRVSSTCPPSV